MTEFECSSTWESDRCSSLPARIGNDQTVALRKIATSDTTYDTRLTANTGLGLLQWVRPNDQKRAHVNAIVLCNLTLMMRRRTPAQAVQTP
jgi:hypothetical protein